jgi:hypothetical protein
VSTRDDARDAAMEPSAGEFLARLVKAGRETIREYLRREEERNAAAARVGREALSERDNADGLLDEKEESHGALGK